MAAGSEGTDWVHLRADYEAGLRPLSAIAAEAGVSRQALAAVARREGWKLRRSGRRGNTIARLKDLLQRRLSELESQIGTLGEEASAATSERDIRAMNTLVRTLEKVLELERKDRAGRLRKRRERRQFDDAEREALAGRLAALHGELEGAAPVPEAEASGGEGDQP